MNTPLVRDTLIDPAPLAPAVLLAPLMKLRPVPTQRIASANIAKIVLAKLFEREHAIFITTLFARIVRLAFRGKLIKHGRAIFTTTLFATTAPPAFLE